MIECLKRIILEYQNLAPPGGRLPRRVAIGSLPGKVTVVTGVRGSGKTTSLRQRIRQLIGSGVPPENILYLDLADDRLYWLRHENPDLIVEAYYELHPQKRKRAGPLLLRRGASAPELADLHRPSDA